MKFLNCKKYLFLALDEEKLDFKIGLKRHISFEIEIDALS